MSLLVAVGVGFTIIWPPGRWSASLASAVGLAGALVVVTSAGIAQARAMTRRRQRALTVPGDAKVALAVHRGRWAASGLRGAMAALSVAVVVLAAQVIAR